MASRDEYYWWKISVEKKAEIQREAERQFWLRIAGLISAFILFVALALPAAAQLPPGPMQHQGRVAFNPIPLDKMYQVREKLIKEYVLEKHLAWGVSVCGDEDLFGNEEAWLTMYVYEDIYKKSLAEFPIIVNDIRIRKEVIPRKH